MKILHVSLGPLGFRSGGLAAYAQDLILSQKDMGHEVVMLYPGHFSIFRKTKINKKKNEKYELHEIVNPNFVAIPFGIKNPKKYMKEIDTQIYIDYLTNLNPKVIHIHTLMGIHKAFFKAAKELKIPTIYTTHDYYALCAKTNMIDFEGKICNEITGERCAQCNSNIHSTTLMQYIMQSSFYQRLKNTQIFRYIRKIKKKKSIYLASKKINQEQILQYENLNEYRLNCLKNIDIIHCNSNLAKEVYDKYIDNKKKVIPITLSDIKDNRKLRMKKEEDKIKIGYIGNLDFYKGLNLLLDSIKILSKENNSYELHLYGDDFSSLNIPKNLNCIKNQRFFRNEIESIMTNLDILVVPSVWKETFGFTALEGLSYGVPVIVSEFVGSKDIIEKIDENCVFKIDSFDLYTKLKQFIENKEYRENLIKKFKNSKIEFEMKNHTNEILNFYDLFF